MIPYYVMITHTGELVDTEVLNNVLMRAEMKDRSTHDETATFEEGGSERTLALHDTMMHWPDAGVPSQDSRVLQQVSGTSVGTLPSITSSTGLPSSAATLLRHQVDGSNGFLFPSPHGRDGKDGKDNPTFSEPHDQDDKATMGGHIDESDKLTTPAQLSLAKAAPASTVRFAVDSVTSVQSMESAGVVRLTPPASPRQPVRIVSPSLQPSADDLAPATEQFVTVNMDNIITKGNSGDVARQMQNIAAGLRNIGRHGLFDDWLVFASSLLCSYDVLCWGFQLRLPTHRRLCTQHLNHPMTTERHWTPSHHIARGQQCK
jgi:hypothetical protein